MNALGTHLILELKDCIPQYLDDVTFLRSVLLEAAERMGATVIGDSFHKFSPQGVTGVVLLAESHLCIHTWPEHRYAAVDIFTCGSSIRPAHSPDLIRQRLGAAECSVLELKRGVLPEQVTLLQP